MTEGPFQLYIIVTSSYEVERSIAPLHHRYIIVTSSYEVERSISPLHHRYIIVNTKVALGYICEIWDRH